MNITPLATAIRENPALHTEVKATLEELIPLMVRLNSAFFSGATNPVIGEELNASATLTSGLYHLQEALMVEEQKPKAAPRKKGPMPAPTPIDPNNTPQPREELPESAASTVGEPNDSAKGDAQ